MTEFETHQFSKPIFIFKSQYNDATKPNNAEDSGSLERWLPLKNKNRAKKCSDNWMIYDEWM